MNPGVGRSSALRTWLRQERAAVTVLQIGAAQMRNPRWKTYAELQGFLRATTENYHRVAVQRTMREVLGALQEIFDTQELRRQLAETGPGVLVPGPGGVQ
jgi:hypothetical protein